MRHPLKFVLKALLTRCKRADMGTGMGEGLRVTLSHPYVTPVSEYQTNLFCLVTRGGSCRSPNKVSAE